jgi:hypothetical protein
MAKLRPAGRMRLAIDFLRPLYQNINDKQPNLGTYFELNDRKLRYFGLKWGKQTVLFICWKLACKQKSLATPDIEQEMSLLILNIQIELNAQSRLINNNNNVSFAFTMTTTHSTKNNDCTWL